jgi:hypothetical protein
VAVEFFAGWCGHCQAFAPVWTLVASQACSAAPALRVGAVDCVADFLSALAFSNLCGPTHTHATSWPASPPTQYARSLGLNPSLLFASSVLRSLRAAKGMAIGSHAATTAAHRRRRLSPTSLLRCRPALSVPHCRACRSCKHQHASARLACGHAILARHQWADSLAPWLRPQSRINGQCHWQICEPGPTAHPHMHTLCHASLKTSRAPQVRRNQRPPFW